MNRIIGISMMLVLWLLSGCGDADQQQKKEAVIRPVRVMTVYASGGERIRTFSGVSQAALESKLSFKVNGTVEKLYVKVGEKVKAGKRIAVLDNELYTLQMQEAKAALRQAKAQLRSAANTYKRIQQLYVNKNASQSELDSSRAQFESVEAAVASLEKRLAQTDLQLTYTSLYAPVDGAIAAVPVEVNENVQAGQPVAILSTSTKLEVNTVVPEVLISDIKEGSVVQVVFDALPEKVFTATVTEVGVSAMSASTTFPVTVRIDETSDALRPGMAAEVSFRLISPIMKERFVVPTFSVSNDGDTDFVYVVTPEADGLGKVNRRVVKTGGLDAGGIIVYEGLNDGDKVLTAGVSKVHDGLIVRLPE